MVTPTMLKRNFKNVPPITPRTNRFGFSCNKDRILIVKESSVIPAINAVPRSMTFLVKGLSSLDRKKTTPTISAVVMDQIK